MMHKFGNCRVSDYEGEDGKSVNRPATEYCHIETVLSPKFFTNVV